MEILSVLLAISSTLGLLILFLSGVLAIHVPQALSAIIKKVNSGERDRYFYFVSAFIFSSAAATIAMVYFGSKGMLYWIPSNWGSNVDGDWTSVRDYLAAMMAFIGGLGGIYIIFGYAEVQILRKQEQERVKGFEAYIDRAISLNSVERDAIIKGLVKNNYGDNAMFGDYSTNVYDRIKMAKFLDSLDRTIAFEVQRQK
jgi:hypothetical protein